MTVNLDSILFHWDRSETAPCTLRDIFEGTLCLGATGGGKTSGFGELAAPALLRHQSRFGGLILTAKRDDRDLWIRYAREAGREADLLIFSLNPDDPAYCFNFLDDPAVHNSPGGDVFNLVALFETIIKSLEKGPGNSSESPFWKHSLRMLMRNGIILLKQARGRVSISDLHQLILTAPRDVRQVANWEELEQRQDELNASDLERLQLSKEWHSQFCCEVISEALESESTPIQQRDLNHAITFFTQTWPILPAETRESVAMTLLNVIDYFMTGPLHELMASETNISPACLFDGKLILIDLPVLVYQEMGVLVNTIWKYCTQLAIQQRTIDSESCPVFIWADEAQLTLTAYDVKFQTIARSHRAATIYLTQSLDAFYEVLGTNHPAQAKVAVNSLLGNLNSKVILANTSTTTNEWCANLIGKSWNWDAHSFGENHSTQWGSQQGVGISDGDSLGVQRVYRYQVEPVEFTQLKRGGADREVEAILVQGGRVFPSTGKNFMRTVFKQPDLSESNAVSFQASQWFDIDCPNCQRLLRFGVEDAAMQTECPHCQRQFQLP